VIAWSAHLQFLFAEVPYLERPAAAWAAGFRCVETAWPGTDGPEFAARVAALGLSVACVNSWAGDVAGGDRGVVHDPSLIRESDAAFLAAVAFAERVGAPCVHMPLGRVRRPGDRARSRRVAVSALRRHARLACRRGVTIVLEPINSHDTPGYLAPSLASVTELIDDVGEDGLTILFDAYHVARAGDDPVAAVSAYAGRIGHAQFSDAPGRGKPGSGRLDLSAFVRELAASGYDGAVGLEWVPRAVTRAELDALPCLEAVAPLGTA
jgi:hydroxypyruvate isomerase